MTPELAQWQESPECIAWWEKQLNCAAGKLLMGVLQSLTTARNIQNINADLAARNAVLFVGQQQGAQQVMDNMFMLARSTPEAPKQPHANYGADLPAAAKPKRKKP